jgi:hypothetical protein
LNGAAVAGGFSGEQHGHAPSDFGGVVVLLDVLGELVAPGVPDDLGFLRRDRLAFSGHDGGSGNATGTNSKQEISAGESGL